MTDPTLQQQAREYAARNKITLIFDSRIGFGSDGKVWESDRATAVKAIGRLRNYTNERTCYTGLKASGVNKINEFTVPSLVGFDDELQVIEVKIVSPPFLLDFGKVWLDNPPDYSAETIEDSMRETKERFGENFNF